MDRDRTVAVGAGDPRADLSQAREHFGMRMPEAIASAARNDRDARLDPGEERGARAPAAPVVRDDQRFGLEVEIGRQEGALTGRVEIGRNENAARARPRTHDDRSVVRR
jgi:hypothetical protein